MVHRTPYSYHPKRLHFLKLQKTLQSMFTSVHTNENIEFCFQCLFCRPIEGYKDKAVLRKKNWMLNITRSSTYIHIHTGENRFLNSDLSNAWDHTSSWPNFWSIDSPIRTPIDTYNCVLLLWPFSSQVPETTLIKSKNWKKNAMVTIASDNKHI